MRSAGKAASEYDNHARKMLALIDARHLMVRGLGFVDIHLLVSAVPDGVRRWSLDKRLEAEARVLGGAADG